MYSGLKEHAECLHNIIPMLMHVPYSYNFALSVVAVRLLGEGEVHLPSRRGTKRCFYFLLISFLRESFFVKLRLRVNFCSHLITIKKVLIYSELIFYRNWGWAEEMYVSAPRSREIGYQCCKKKYENRPTPS